MHEEALGLARDRVAGQRLSSEAGVPALLCRLLPVLQVAPDQSSLHRHRPTDVPIHPTADEQAFTAAATYCCSAAAITGATDLVCAL